ncbi:hypothetical protein ACIQV3_34105 [Streptomyces sp. NPDC099050]|uniref:hypothetical protein n=1 Tax=Streptomyces sp. NPDC099050 TaxID=3366100 RepID=UPI00381EA2D2
MRARTAGRRARRLFERYGVVGFGLAGPALFGTWGSSLLGAALGIPRWRLIRWLMAGVTLWCTVLLVASDAVPFTPDDLPGYAGRLFDYCRQHPEVIRLATWHRLERGDSHDRDPAVAAPTRDAKLEALDSVQKKDGTGADFSPTALLTLVLSIALAWNPGNPTGMPAATTEAESADDRRRSIVRAVRRLL